MIGLIAAALTGGFAVASTEAPEGDEGAYLQRGPIPFEAFDRDGDGRLSADEFHEVRAARQAYRAKQGYPMRRAAGAPPFEAIDTDGDGMLSREEHAAHQAARHASRPCVNEGMRW